MTATILQQTSLPIREPNQAATTGGLGSSPIVQSLNHSSGGEGLTRDQLASQKASTVLKPTGNTALPSEELVRETADLKAAGASGLGGAGGAEVAKANLTSQSQPLASNTTSTVLRPTGSTALPSSEIVGETADLHAAGVTGIGGGGPKEIAAANLGTLPSMPAYPASKTGESETPGRQLPGAWLDNSTKPADTSLYEDVTKGIKEVKLDEYVHAAEAAAAGAAAVAAGTATGLFEKIQHSLGYGDAADDIQQKAAHDRMARVAPIAAGVASDITGHGKNDYTFGPESGNTTANGSFTDLPSLAEQRVPGSSPLAANNVIGAGAVIDGNVDSANRDGFSKGEAVAIGGASAAIAGGALAATRAKDQEPVSGVTKDGNPVTPAGAAAAINNMSGAAAGKPNPTPKNNTTLQSTGAPALPAPEAVQETKDLVQQSSAPQSSSKGPTSLKPTGASALPNPEIVSDIKDHVHDSIPSSNTSTGTTATGGGLAGAALGMPALTGVKENPDHANPNSDPHLTGESASTIKSQSVPAPTIGHVHDPADEPVSPAPSSGKKPGFGSVIKGEIKIISGKLSHNDEKVALGEKIKAGEA